MEHYLSSNLFTLGKKNINEMSSKILSWFCFEKIMTMLKISISYEFDTSYDISCYKKILWQCHDNVRLNGNSMTLSCHVIWQKSLWQKMNHFSIKYGFSLTKEYVMTNDNFMTISGHVTIPWQCYVLHDKNHLDIAWLLRQNGKISYHQIRNQSWSK